MKGAYAIMGGVCGWLFLSASAAYAADAAGSSLQAGGLKPPEAVQSEPSTAPPSQTEQTLDRADKEDSGRGLEFVWLNADVGPEYLGLQTFKAKNLVDPALVDSKDLGLSYGAGAGIRLLVFSFGARFRLANFSDWRLWTLNAEAGIHFPLGRLEPYATLGAGYASLGSFDDARLAGASVDSAHGLDVRGGVGLDVYLTNTLSLGGNLTGDLLFLSRSASAPPGAGVAGSGAFYTRDGSGIGGGVALSAVFGLHF